MPLVSGFSQWSPRRLLGTPPIHPVPFLLGKVAFFASWGLLVLGLLGVRVPSTPFPGLRFLAAPIHLIGALLIFAALATLGTSARVGLPREETSLRTGGLYRLSRNPLYMGVYLICCAAVVFAPHWLVIACSLVAVGVHHRIVLAEEGFLETRFGQAWREYQAKVRRYL